MLEVDYRGVILVACIVAISWTISIYTIAKNTTGDKAKKKSSGSAKAAKTGAKATKSRGSAAKTGSSAKKSRAKK